MCRYLLSKHDIFLHQMFYHTECPADPYFTHFCTTFFLSTECPAEPNLTFFLPFFSSPQNVRWNSLDLELPAHYLKLLNVLMERSAAVDSATLSKENPSENILLRVWTMPPKKVSLRKVMSNPHAHSMDSATPSENIPYRTFLMVKVYLSTLLQCGKCNPNLEKSFKAHISSIFLRAFIAWLMSTGQCHPK